MDQQRQPLALSALYQHLYQHYGAQHWWPAGDRFEILLGAILTQNVAWSRVETALHSLRLHTPLTAQGLLQLDETVLQACLRPVGYFRQKSDRVRRFCQWLLAQGGMNALHTLSSEHLRAVLLAQHGIGPETADDMLLYAWQRPVFVIDAYSRRILARVGHPEQALWPYERLRLWWQAGLETDGGSESALLTTYQEYHALLVCHAKAVCRKRVPRCTACCLFTVCPAANRKAVGY